MSYQVPAGWCRGEPIEIEQTATGRLIVAQRLMASASHNDPEDIAFITFYEMKDLSDWLRWWYNDDIQRVIHYEAHIH